MTTALLRGCLQATAAALQPAAAHAQPGASAWHCRGCGGASPSSGPPAAATRCSKPGGRGPATVRGLAPLLDFHNSRSRLQTQCSNASDATDGPANRPGKNSMPLISDRYRSKLESLYYCDTSTPREKIETPKGLPVQAKSIGEYPPCSKCEVLGAVSCPTCAGCGLYVEPTLESQGVIVKVRCLGCGGSGTVMCPTCGGRGHL
eukprot:SM000017S02863  [mRNA]  locus=s17:706249:707768:- [translate_table: standard]